MEQMKTKLKEKNPSAVSLGKLSWEKRKKDPKELKRLQRIGADGGNKRWAVYNAKKRSKTKGL